MTPTSTATTSKVRLNRLEAALVAYLEAHRDRPVSRDELLVNVWDYARSVSTRTVDQHVCVVRQKLGAEIIKTVRTEGYQWMGDVTETYPNVHGQLVGDPHG